MNPQECPILKNAGVNITDAGYGSWRDQEEANKVKELCLECPYDKCIFDEDSEKRHRLEKSLLHFMEKKRLDGRQRKRLQEVQQKLEEMNSKENH